MGPTASGKTAAAIALVQQLPCEIISVDSAMIYKGMDIGTAKPTADELALAPHRLIDICDPAETYSAGQFRKDALSEIERVHAAGRIPLLTGGTMLYFHVLQHGVASLPNADKKIREQLDQQAHEMGWPAMHAQLEKLDPDMAKLLHPNDSQRIQRALEVYYASGVPLSVLQKQQGEPLAYSVVNIVLAPSDRKSLHELIEKRFHQMLAQGFLEEVTTLFKRSDLSLDLPSMRSVGYRQAWQYLNGDIDKETMIYRAIVATRQLAKRQFTWLRRWKDCATWIEAYDTHAKQQVIESVKRNLP